MKNIVLLTVILIAFVLSSFGQKAEVEKRMQEYGIPSDFFVDNLKDENAKYSFSIRTTTETTGQETKDGTVYRFFV